ncbi:MAG: hypothetical protein KAQ79_14225, partial [Cyclobacteriaceae bacterium]|nr:hypothetical protein [Cyclobacteriaceae bacterium]
STYTRNLYATGVELPDVPFESFVKSLITVNNATQVSWAGNANLSYSHRYFGLRLQYRRIEPEYQTMGAYFFNNDIENITIDPSFFLLKRKLNIRGSIGYQRNNLSNNRINETFRKVSSLNMNYSPSRKISMSISYRNFRIEQSRNPLIIKDFVDSLLMKQFTTNFSANLNYNFGDKDIRQTMTIGTSFQQFNEDNPNIENGNFSSSQSPYISYRLNNTISKYSIYGRINYNDFKTTSANQTRLGMTVGGSKRMADNKFNLNISGTLNKNSHNNESDGSTTMLRARLNYKVIKNHNLNVSLNFIDRKFKRDDKNNFNEFMLRFGYTMRI